MKNVEVGGFGLKALRAVTGPKPTFKCDNCRCMRYSPCGCVKRRAKKG